MVNFEWYRSFVAIYQAGTITSASEVLFLTQPAVSQHLNALESTLGTKLFERMPRKMVPTDDGKALYTRVISSVNTLESTTSNYYRDKNKPQALIRLGSPSDFFSAMVLPHLGEDDSIFRVSFGNAKLLLDQLERRKLDIVIATKKESYNKAIEYKKLFIEEFVLIQSTQSNSSLKAFTNNNTTAPSESLLQQQNWISYDTDLPIIRRFWREVFQTRPAITPSIIIPNLSIMLKAVEADKGISILPSYICQAAIERGNVEVINFDNKSISNEIYIAYRKEDLKKPNISGFINTLVSGL